MKWIVRARALQNHLAIPIIRDTSCPKQVSKQEKAFALDVFLSWFRIFDLEQVVALPARTSHFEMSASERAVRIRALPREHV